MDKRTIILRADGGPTIGMGHFIRTLALAEMLNEHFYCVYATRKPTTYQISEIDKVCNSRIDLPEDDSHFQLFLEKLKGNEIVVLDNYYFNTDYQRAIKAKGCKLVCIDDLHDKHFVADIVINHAEGIDPKNYSTESCTKLLLGYEYALLRSNYSEEHDSNKMKDYSCLIMIGGADPLGLTDKFVSYLRNYNFAKPVAVVGGANSSLTEQSDSFHFFSQLSAREIKDLMNASEFAILPASTVAIEACALRLPFICGYFIDNQEEIYKGIKSNNLAVCIDDLIVIEKQKLLEAIGTISSKIVSTQIIQNQKQRLDNKSKGRLNHIFCELWS